MEPCGCEMLQQAQRNPDAIARETMTEQANVFREQWKCPGRTGDEPSHCSDDVRSMLLPVERLTGVSGLKTCPHWYASRPWAHYAARARRWREHGELSAVATPTSALVFAIEEIDAGKSARDHDDDEKREQRRKRDGH